MVNFHPHLRDRLVPIDTITQHPDNANNGDIDAVVESMRVNGVYAGVLVQRSTGRMVFGHTRYHALLALGATEIPADYIDCDDHRALRILEVDNKSNRLGRIDPAQVLKNLDILSETEQGLAGTGWSHEEVDWMLADAAAPPINDEGFGHRLHTPTTWSVVIDFNNEEDAERLTEEMEERGYQVRTVDL